MPGLSPGSNLSVLRPPDVLRRHKSLLTAYAEKNTAHNQGIVFSDGQDSVTFN